MKGHTQERNRSFPSCFEPHCENEAMCIDFIMKISWHSYANKTNFHMKSFAFSLTFVMTLKATSRDFHEQQNKTIITPYTTCLVAVSVDAVT